MLDGCVLCFFELCEDGHGKYCCLGLLEAVLRWARCEPKGRLDFQNRRAVI
jgi:hypothetical protein